MYTYLLINSYFNLLQSLVITVKFIISNLEGDFISRDHKSIYVQYANVIIVKYCASMFRTGSNLSYLAFALSRYITVRNNKESFLAKFHKLNSKLFVFIIVAISLVINIYVYFQFKIKFTMTDWEQSHKIHSNNFSNYYRQEPIDDYKESFSSESEYILLNIGQYVRIIFSDLAHIIATTVIDIVLLLFVRKKMKIKRNLLQANTVLNLVIMSSIQRNKIKKRQEQPKDRISSMIIINGINWFFLRFPLALSSFYGFLFRYDRKARSYEPDLASYIVCKKKKFCVASQEVFVFLYLFSFFVQFFIFYKLDTNFKLCIASFKKRLRFKKTQETDYELNTRTNRV